MDSLVEWCPWLLDNNMKVTVGEDHVIIPTTTTKIWVQVHQLPFGFMDVSIGALVGSQIGKMV